MPHNTSKQHPCTWFGCTKSFSRGDHLKRHTLNHTSGSSTCPRCRAHFKRPDLLNRHLERHRQKDEEAGGRGLGVVETRKRLWRDEGGNIVQDRPATRTRINADSSSNNTDSDCEDDDDVDDNLDEQHIGDHVEYHGQQISAQPIITMTPPASLRNIDDRDDGELDLSHDLQFDLGSEEHDEMDLTDFLANSEWGLQSTERVPASSWTFDNIFKPDTASSFNMPFTTMSNYNWLFDMMANNIIPSSEPACGPTTQHIQPVQTELRVSTVDPTQTVRSDQLRDRPSFNGQTRTGNTSPSDQSFSKSWLAGVTQQETARHNVPSGNSTKAASSHRLRLPKPAQDASVSPVATNQINPRTRVTAPASTIDRGDHVPDLAIRPHIDLSLLTPPDYQQTRYSTDVEDLPTITSAVRDKLLEWVLKANPKTPEGVTIQRTHAKLALTALQEYFDAFFQHFNRSYPLIHRATFRPEHAEAPFLLSVLLLGATYCDKTAHLLAVCIHDVMRPQIFSHCGFSATPPLWMLQTMLLVECFGKVRAGQKQHDMAHLFHGLLINLIRRSDCQTVMEDRPQSRRATLEERWRSAMDIEQRRRVAFLCFMWDTQHAVLFSQSLCMSAFELRTLMPCSTAAWEAESADEWEAISRDESGKLFLPVLKSYISSSSLPDSEDLNALSRLLVLHGLMSISWDMRRRQQTSLGVVADKEDDWPIRLSRAYDKWKADFDSFTMDMAMAACDDPEAKTRFTRFTVTSTAIYHAAHIILNVEVLDLQIYAGARHIIGRPVIAGDKDRSRRVMEQWVHSQSLQAPTASWHAAHLIRATILHHDDDNISNAFHYAWCLYLATLTIWACQHAGDSTVSEARLSNSRLPVSGDGRTEMNALISSMTNRTPEQIRQTINKYPVHGLLRATTKWISNVRWAIIHEGSKVLRGLLKEEFGANEGG